MFLIFKMKYLNYFIVHVEIVTNQTLAALDCKKKNCVNFIADNFIQRKSIPWTPKLIWLASKIFPSLGGIEGGH